MPPLVLYYQSPTSLRNLILREGLLVKDSNLSMRSVFLSDRIPPKSHQLDIYTVDATGLNLEEDATTDASAGQRWYRSHSDILPTALQALNGQAIEASTLLSLGQLRSRAIAASSALNALTDSAHDGENIDAEQYGHCCMAVAQCSSDLFDALALVDDSVFALEGKTSDGRLITLTPSAQQTGKYQLTRFAKDGDPFGDTQYTSKAQAIEHFCDEIDLATLAGFELDFSDKPALAQPNDAFLAPVPHSASFLKWFAHSKVVDDKGMPLIAYHGTKADIDSFRLGGKGKTHDTGAFFSDTPSIANTYATPDGCVMPTYLSLQNPLVIDCNGKNWNSLDGKVKVQLPRTLVTEHTDLQHLDFLERTITNKDSGKVLPAAKLSLNKLFPREFIYDDDFTSTDDLARWARKCGYESVIFKNVRDRGPDGALSTEASKLPATVYVAFHEEQIKSALGSGLEFDATSPFITSKSPQALQEQIRQFCSNPADSLAKPSEESRRLMAVDQYLSNMTASQQIAYLTHALTIHTGLPENLANDHVENLISSRPPEQAFEQLLIDLGPHWHTPNYEPPRASTHTDKRASAEPQLSLEI